MLRKHLRTFGENQISNIIRRTKGKKTLEFHQFYIIERQKNRKDTHKSRKAFFPNWKQQKTHLSQRKTLKIKQKMEEFLENLEESLTLAKRFVSSKN